MGSELYLYLQFETRIHERVNEYDLWSNPITWDLTENFEICNGKPYDFMMSIGLRGGTDAYFPKRGFPSTGIPKCILDNWDLSYDGNYATWLYLDEILMCLNHKRLNIDKLESEQLIILLRTVFYSEELYGNRSVRLIAIEST